MDLKNYQWESEFARSHIAEGEAKGDAKSILAVLETRGLPVSDEVRDRVTGCTDLQQLEQWVRRAVTVDKAEEIFD